MAIINLFALPGQILHYPF